MAADKTFGVKVSDELYEKVKQLVDTSGLSAKDWFEKAVTLTELQSIKEGVRDYSQDLNELEVHTTRIYELVTNMVQRSIYLKDHAVKEISDKLKQTEMVIGEYQEKTKIAIEESKIAKEELEKAKEEKEELAKQLVQLLSTNENNQLLIAEFREKNNSLTEVLAEYKTYADENKQLKDFLARERERFETEITTTLSKSEDLRVQNEDLKRQLITMETQYENEHERLTEKYQFEKNNAILEIERQYQSKLLQANDNYTSKVQSLYDDMEKQRKVYEERIAEANKPLNKSSNNTKE